MYSKIAYLSAWSARCACRGVLVAASRRSSHKARCRRHVRRGRCFRAGRLGGGDARRPRRCTGWTQSVVATPRVSRGRMGRPVGWICSLTGRLPMKSSDAPRHRWEIQREFWRVIATGLTSEAAAITVGVAPVVGCRWFRHAGGMQPFSLVESSGRYLTFSEREEIAILRAQGAGVRQIARRIGRDPSTVSRELRRNAATRDGKLEYRTCVAQWKAEMMARRPKAAKLVANPRLREYL